MNQVNGKQSIIGELKKAPIVHLACSKAGVSRTTYYRWRKEDASFRRQTDEAILEGIFLINDLAESKLISAIQDREMTAIIFWLKHRHAAYAPRIEILKREIDETLTPEQVKQLKRALELTATGNSKIGDKKTYENRPKATKNQ